MKRKRITFLAMLMLAVILLMSSSIKLAQGTPAISKWLGRNARDPFISYPASTFSNRCCKPWTQVYIFPGKRIFYRQRQDR